MEAIDHELKARCTVLGRKRFRGKREFHLGHIELEIFVIKWRFEYTVGYSYLKFCRNTKSVHVHLEVINLQVVT